jgi:hypothetical protein
MQAKQGDWLVVHSRRLDEEVREGLILEVRHTDGSPPYLVRWLDDEHQALVFPGSDARVLPAGLHARPSGRRGPADR